MKAWRWVLAAGAMACGARGADTVSLARIHGTIGPATADYVSRVTAQAGQRGSQCLIVELDTPGGLLESTKAIVQTMYSSPVPVVVYVAPSGANAGSAGCFITLAADVAAMAPNTSIGAAHPVEMNSTGSSQPPDAVMTKKLENFAASYIEAIADKRHRNVAWAKASVLESASITAERALEMHVVDVVASDIPDLLRKLDGRTIGEHTLRTARAAVDEIPMATRERLFQMLWRPEVMLVLMLAAIYGILGELSNPGAVLPGVVGGIALILSLYMASILPISMAGAALIVLAVILFVIDVYSPTHGLLTAGGIIAFFLGALFLFDRSNPEFRLSYFAVVSATVVTALFFVFVIGAGLRAQRLPKRVGREALVGRVVPALDLIDANQGHVFVEGEYWSARSDDVVAPGASVEIVAVRGLTLAVRAKSIVL